MQNNIRHNRINLLSNYKIKIHSSKELIGLRNNLLKTYENVLEKESNEKFKYMLKTLKSTYSDDIFVYSRRCRKALVKIKTLITLRDMYTFCAYEITKKK